MCMCVCGEVGGCMCVGRLGCGGSVWEVCRGGYENRSQVVLELCCKLQAVVGLWGWGGDSGGRGSCTCRERSD